MIAPHNPVCAVQPPVIVQRDWTKVCCPQHAAKDGRILAGAQAVALIANTRHGPQNQYISHEHAYRCIAEAVLAAVAEYDAESQVA